MLVPTIEGLTRRGGRGRGSRHSRHHHPSGGRRRSWWAPNWGGYNFVPYWLLSRSIVDTSPATVNVTEDDPYITQVSRISQTLKLILLALAILFGGYYFYKNVVKK